MLVAGRVEISRLKLLRRRALQQERINNNLTGGKWRWVIGIGSGDYVRTMIWISSAVP